MNKHHLKAIRIAEKVFASLKEFIKPGISEKAAACEIRKRLKSFGAKKESFHVIVASGKRSSKIHGFATTRKIRTDEIIMLDFGALYNGWRSDITRCYVLGRPTERQQKRYDLLKRAQLAGIKKVRAGVKCSVIDAAVRQVLKKAGFSDYFIHSTGHGIGRKTHQAPKISSKNDNILKGGEVITIEPGIYLKKWGGLRIEDMILVKKNGYKVLSRASRRLGL